MCADTSDKVRIDRLRRVARRRGFVFRKVRRIDKLATDFGKFELSASDHQTIIGSLDEVERALDDVHR